MAERHREIISRRGRPVVGWFCSYTPLEIIDAAGLHPYRIVPEPGRAMTRADSYIDRNCCPYVRTILGEALDGAYDFLDGLVVVNSCDPMRRLYDVWRYNIEGKFIHLLDLPRIETESAVAYYRECLLGLVAALEDRFQVTISDAALAKAIADRNRTRSLLRELYLANRESGHLPAAQLHGVVRAGTLLPQDDFAGMLERLLDEVKNAPVEFKEGPRLLITGSIMDNPQIVEFIEECDARMVGDDLCNGTRQFWYEIEPDGDPLAALSRHYLGRTPCPRMKDAQRRFDHVLRMVDDFRADGVVFYTLKFCDPFLFDVPLLKEQLEQRGIPSLLLEGDYTPGTLGRVRTRIEAFIEMLRQNVRTA
ncbi:MAG: 2-hydroxyacyl-CoA dehydratase family protein [Chloroflexota bacterium]